jgi:hypothetical protein
MLRLLNQSLKSSWLRWRFRQIRKKVSILNKKKLLIKRESRCETQSLRT